MSALQSLLGFLALQGAHGTATTTTTAGQTIVQVAQGTAALSTFVAALTNERSLLFRMRHRYNSGGATCTGGYGACNPYVWTVFAPSNAAFDALPAGVLTNLLKPEKKHLLLAWLEYHVIGSSHYVIGDMTNFQNLTTMNTQNVMVTIPPGAPKIYKINDAKITTPDVQATNGVVHIIDKVLVPKNIVQLAQATATLSTLVLAVVAADLVTTLTGDGPFNGPFTVFAPTNGAFASLPDGKLTSLLKPANKAELVSVLTYHVVAPQDTKTHSPDYFGGDFAHALKNNTQITTVQGGTYKVKRNGDTIMIGKTPANAGANLPKITTANVKASNGLVHIVDKVLIPPIPPNTTEHVSSTASSTGIITAVVVALGLCAIQ